MQKMLITALISLSACSYAASAKPTIEILATGGTIAGTASSNTATIYKAGDLTIDQLAESVPELKDKANLLYQQVYNKDSGNTTLEDWKKLALAVQKAVDDPKINGVVITHGTDTMEETAYFLNLVIKTKKPIVLVGSMRPSTSLSADGPLNLYNAVSVAASPTSYDKGVLVIMNEDIHNSRYVEKINTIGINAFKSTGLGVQGHVYLGDVDYEFDITKKHTDQSQFSINKDTKFPDVEIIYEYVGVNTEMLDNILKTKNLKGLIIAGVGDGNIPDYESDFLKKARSMGIVIVRSSRVGSGHVTYDYNNLDTTYGIIPANNLNPQKARILLALGLMKTNDIKILAQYFNQY